MNFKNIKQAVLEKLKELGIIRPAPPKPWKYCIHCGCNVEPKDETCPQCSKKLHAKHLALIAWLKQYTKDNIICTVEDNLYEAIKNFILSHIYGTILSIAVVTAATAGVYASEPYIKEVNSRPEELSDVMGEEFYYSDGYYPGYEDSWSDQNSGSNQNSGSDDNLFNDNFNIVSLNLPTSRQSRDETIENYLNLLFESPDADNEDLATYYVPEEMFRYTRSLDMDLASLSEALGMDISSNDLIALNNYGTRYINRWQPDTNAPLWELDRHSDLYLMHPQFKLLGSDTYIIYNFYLCNYGDYWFVLDSELEDIYTEEEYVVKFSGELYEGSCGTSMEERVAEDNLDDTRKDLFMTAISFLEYTLYNQDITVYDYAEYWQPGLRHLYPDMGSNPDNYYLEEEVGRYMFDSTDISTLNTFGTERVFYNYPIDERSYAYMTMGYEIATLQAHYKADNGTDVRYYANNICFVNVLGYWYFVGGESQGVYTEDEYLVADFTIPEYDYQKTELITQADINDIMEALTLYWTYGSPANSDDINETVVDWSHGTISTDIEGEHHQTTAFLDSLEGTKVTVLETGLESVMVYNNIQPYTEIGEEAKNFTGANYAQFVSYTKYTVNGEEKTAWFMVTMQESSTGWKLIEDVYGGNY